MNAGGNDIRFEPLPLRRRGLASIGGSQYCVWDASGKSKEIKADTAYEAFKNSGVKNPVRIERVSNAVLNILEKSKLAPEKDISATSKESPVNLHERILLRKSPVISADELDELIRSLRKDEAGAAPTIQPVTPAPTVSPTLAPAPKPAAAAPQQTVIPAIGMDVQGDGFDEIIPSAMPVKPLALKPNEPREASGPAAAGAGATLPAAGLPPERELSPEEVEKLLGGK